VIRRTAKDAGPALALLLLLGVIGTFPAAAQARGRSGGATVSATVTIAASVTPASLSAAGRALLVDALRGAPPGPVPIVLGGVPFVAVGPVAHRSEAVAAPPPPTSTLVELAPAPVDGRRLVRVLVAALY
jgi:hypothetical protein